MRNETTQVQAAVASSGALERLLDGFVAAELALLDGLIDADDILPDDAASANVQMTDFRVAHQTLGQTNCQRRSFQLSEAVGILGQLVHHRRVGVGNGIAILGRIFRGNPPPINDD